MKSLRLLILLFVSSLFANGQNCIDAIIYLGENKDVKDTIFCMILSDDEEMVTIDNGFAISTISKNLVSEQIKCVRQMTAYEIYKFQGVDAVTRDYFNNSNTAGYELRKAAFSTYIATGLAVLAGASFFIGFTNDNHPKPWLVSGGVITAASLFFVVRAWNHIYKAGKLLDLNNNTSLYLDATPEGNLGLLLKF